MTKVTKAASYSQIRKGLKDEKDCIDFVAFYVNSAGVCSGGESKCE